MSVWILFMIFKMFDILYTSSILSSRMILFVFLGVFVFLFEWIVCFVVVLRFYFLFFLFVICIVGLFVLVLNLFFDEIKCRFVDKEFLAIYSALKLISTDLSILGSCFFDVLFLFLFVICFLIKLNWSLIWEFVDNFVYERLLGGLCMMV